MFAPSDLPERTDVGTKARLDEILNKAPVKALW